VNQSVGSEIQSAYLRTCLVGASVRFWHQASVCAVQGQSGVGGKADLPVERPDFSILTQAV
jgi:hypothetical protein